MFLTVLAQELSVVAASGICLGTAVLCKRLFIPAKIVDKYLHEHEGKWFTIHDIVRWYANETGKEIIIGGVEYTMIKNRLSSLNDKGVIRKDTSSWLPENWEYCYGTKRKRKGG